MPPARARAGGLMMDDVVLANNALRIHIRWCKTDVLGHGEWGPLHSVQSPVCPISVISEFLACRTQGSHFVVRGRVSGLAISMSISVKKVFGARGG